MHKIKLLLTLSLIAILVGCASAQKDYGMHVSPITNVAKNTKEILELSKPITLKQEDEEIWDITFQDPVMQLGNTKNNYKVFRFSGQKDQAYRLELWSRCACFGFNKTVMTPLAFIMNADGKIVNSKPVKFGQGRMGFTRPININGVWEGQFKNNDHLYFVVSADNRAIGGSAGSFSSTSIAIPYMPIYMSMKHYPAGEVETLLTISN